MKWFTILCVSLTWWFTGNTALAETKQLEHRFNGAQAVSKITLDDQCSDAIDYAALISAKVYNPQNAKLDTCADVSTGDGILQSDGVTQQDIDIPMDIVPQLCLSQISCVVIFTFYVADHTHGQTYVFTPSETDTRLPRIGKIHVASGKIQDLILRTTDHGNRWNMALVDAPNM